MSSDRTTILCISSFEKGAEFLRECGRLGCRTLLLTLESLAEAPWPRESIDDVFLMPDLYRRQDVFNAVSYLARTERIARVVPLDEFDVEMAASLREHLRLPGMGESAARLFRDKLAMRTAARDFGIPVPDYSPVLNHADLRQFVRTVPAPWLLKPRMSASTTGIRKLHGEEGLWGALEELGDEQSLFLLERFVPGDVLHVDAVVHGGRVVFGEAHAYGRPPFAVYHGGGLFSSRTLERGGDLSESLLEANRTVVEAFGLEAGVVHTEFIRAAGGSLHFLETAARVGGAHIAEMVEAATGVNLWREWARVETSLARSVAYAAPRPREDYGGLLITLARQQQPDLVAYDAEEIVLKLDKPHHAGLVLASPDHGRVQALLEEYARRFAADFHAVLPPAAAPTT